MALEDNDFDYAGLISATRRRDFSNSQEMPLEIFVISKRTAHLYYYQRRRSSQIIGVIYWLLVANFIRHNLEYQVTGHE